MPKARFNSRTREGCDSSSAVSDRILFLFQFTHPGGVRLPKDYFTGVVPSVSIHAPGRGATTIKACNIVCQVCFNSRTREGCDVPRMRSMMQPSEFQFTHPGGVRRDFSNMFVNSVSLFQFTHPGGVRQCGAKLRIMGRINKRNLRLEVLL